MTDRPAHPSVPTRHRALVGDDTVQAHRSAPPPVVLRLPGHHGPGRRRRLVRAATMTGVLGVALATQVHLPRPTSAEAAVSAVDTARPTERTATPEDPAPATTEPWRHELLASVRGVELVRPSPAVQVVGFHEAARPGALALVPSHALTESHGREPVATRDRLVHRDLHTLVLPTRARAQPSSSAIDIGMEAGEVVHAPVSGTVESVEPYLLYGRYPDHRIVVRPHDDPSLRVVLLHVTDPAVVPGDDLVAGRTPLAGSANPFPFESQLDRFAVARVGHALPHVHLEVRTD